VVTVIGLDKWRERLVHGLKRKDIEREAIVLRHYVAAVREEDCDSRIKEEKSRLGNARDKTHWLRDSYSGLIFRGLVLGAIFFGVSFASLVSGFIVHAIIVLPLNLVGAYWVTRKLWRGKLEDLALDTHFGPVQKPGLLFDEQLRDRSGNLPPQIEKFVSEFVLVEARKFVVRCLLAMVLYILLIPLIAPSSLTEIPSSVFMIVTCLGVLAVLFRPIRLRDTTEFKQDYSGVRIAPPVLLSALAKTGQVKKVEEIERKIDELHKERHRQRELKTYSGPATHEELLFAVSVNFKPKAVHMEMSEQLATMVKARGTEALARLESTLNEVEKILGERRFTAFWDAVEQCLLAQQDVRYWYSLASWVLQLWARGELPPSDLNQFRRECLSYKLNNPGAVCSSDVMIQQIEQGFGYRALTVHLDDGTTLEMTERDVRAAWRLGLYSEGMKQTPPFEAFFDDLPAPRVELDADALQQLEKCLTRYRDALITADKDFELVSIGQMMKTRTTLVQGFDRLEQAVHSMAAAIAQQVRESQKALQGSIESAADYISGTVATSSEAASEANVRAIGRVEQHIRSLEAIGTSIAVRT